MEKCMLQKLAEARCEPNEVQVESKEKAIKAQAAKKSFIEEMMQPAALAVISVVYRRGCNVLTTIPPPYTKGTTNPGGRHARAAAFSPFFLWEI